MLTWKNDLSDPRVERLKEGQVMDIFMPLGALNRVSCIIKSFYKIYEFVPDVIDASHRVDVGGPVEGAGDHS